MYILLPSFKKQQQDMSKILHSAILAIFLLFHLHVQHSSDSKKQTKSLWIDYCKSWWPAICKFIFKSVLAFLPLYKLYNAIKTLCIHRKTILLFYWGRAYQAVKMRRLQGNKSLKKARRKSQENVLTQVHCNIVV